jgi:hypothetical protein
LGLDIGRSVAGRDKAIVFLRGPIVNDLAGHYLSWDIGLGRIAGEPVVRPGLSWGRGLTFAGRSGWAAIDMLAEMRLVTHEVDYKADLTLGIDLSDRRKLMLQVQSGVQAGDEPFVRLVPSVVFRLSRRTLFEFGITQDMRGARATGIKAALWLEF